MHVNISRNKLLINKRRHLPRKSKSSARSATLYCNHCGGAIRPDGELQTCIMCARELGHECANCLNATANELTDTNKKSA